MLCPAGNHAIIFIQEGPLRDESCPADMTEIVPLSRAAEDTLWAVVASIGRTQRVAEIFPSRTAAVVFVLGDTADTWQPGGASRVTKGLAVP